MDERNEQDYDLRSIVEMRRLRQYKAAGEEMSRLITELLNAWQAQRTETIDSVSAAINALDLANSHLRFAVALLKPSEPLTEAEQVQRACTEG